MAPFSKHLPLRFVNDRWGLSLRYSEPLGNRFRKSSLLVESLDNLQAWRLRSHGCGWKWCEKVCLSSFCTGGRVIGKSNGRSNRSGNSSWLGQPGAIRTISTLSVLTLIRQALNRLVGGMHMRTGRSSSGQDCPLSKTSPPEWVRRILPISCSYLGRTDPQMVCPRHEKSCLLRSGLGSNLSWGFDPSWTDGPLTLSDAREDSRELSHSPLLGPQT